MGTPEANRPFGSPGAREGVLGETSEFLFKVTTAFLAVPYAGIHGYFLFSRPKGKKVRRVNRGRNYFSYALLLFSWIPLLLYLLSPAIDHWRMPIPLALRWLGALLLAAGNSLFYWSHKALGKNWSPFLEIQEGQEFITHGPYRWSRHPIYGSLFLIHIGVALLTANGMVAGVFLVSICLLYLLRVPWEEKMMLEQFGEAYKRYMNQTGRLFPHWRRRDHG